MNCLNFPNIIFFTLFLMFFFVPSDLICQMQAEGDGYFYNHDDGWTYWQDRDGSYYPIHGPGDGHDGQDPPDFDGDYGYEDWDNFWNDDWDYWAWLEYIRDILNDPDYTPDNCPTLISATEVTLPLDRNRQILGIGEEFSVRVWNLCSGASADFEVLNNAGTTAKQIQNGSASNEFAEFSAGYTPGTFRIKVEIAGLNGSECTNCGNTLELEFNVIEPEGVFFEHATLQSCTNQDQTDNDAQHNYNMPSTKYDAFAYLYPDNVNFYNVEVKEKQIADEECGGTYWSFPPTGVSPSNFNCGEHNPPDQWAVMSPYKVVVDGKGTKVLGVDVLGFFWYCNDDFEHANNEGYVKWKIDWFYKRVDENNQNEEEIKFCEVLQTGTNIYSGNNAKFVVEKGVLNSTSGKVSISTNLLDESSCVPLGIPTCQ